MQKPIISYSLSVNGNPWWVANHMSGVTYEVQINQLTGNVLIGMGIMHSINSTLTVEEVLEDGIVQGVLLMNFNQETLEHILRICNEARANRKEVFATG
jgi:hypothetical protein